MIFKNVYMLFELMSYNIIDEENFLKTKFYNFKFIYIKWYKL